jgi:Fe2+ transport system protein B
LHFRSQGLKSGNNFKEFFVDLFLSQGIMPECQILYHLSGISFRSVHGREPLPLGLDMEQLIVASVVLTMYFPCVATFVVLFKELGAMDLIKSTAIMIVSALLVGGILNALL